MNGIPQNFFATKFTSDAPYVLFLSFCRALDKYCDQMGIGNRRFSAVRILHDAALNTVSHMHVVTGTQIRHMAQMEQDIPKMFAGLVEISSNNGVLRTVDRMSVMSLAEMSVIIAKNSYKR